MSYIQFRQKCADCGKEWNAAFGIVGMAYIAQPPACCPHCGGTKLTTAADEWKLEPVALEVVEKDPAA